MKNILTLHLAAVAAVMVSFVGSAKADIPASAYVQDGLIAQWDGIDNAGTGTHDSSAATWIDLKGGDGWSVNSHGSWTDDALVTDGAGYAASRATALNGIVTCEVTFERGGASDSAYGCIFMSGQCTGGYCAYYAYSSKEGSLLVTRGQSIKVMRNKFTTISTIYNLNGNNSTPATAVYRDGALGTILTTDTDYMDAGGANATLGGRYSGSARNYTGKIHSIRIYNRVLSADEIAWNYRLDTDRFANGDDVRLVIDGASTNFQYRVTFTADYTCTVNGDAVTSPAWIAEGATVALTAVSPRALKPGVIPIPLDGVTRVGDVFTFTMDQKAKNIHCSVPSSVYVQDGLVGFYDGIDNAGTGTHDTSATVWKDLAGTIGDGLLGANVIWNGVDGWTNDSDGKPVTLPGTAATLIATKEFTVEFRVNPSRTGTRECFVGSYNTGNFNIEHNGSGSSGLVRGYYNGTPNFYTDFTIVADETATICFSSTYASRTVYKNGGDASYTHVGNATAALTGDKPTIIGGENYRANMAFHGNYYAFRLYDRPLTAAEARINDNVDRMRFEDADPATLTWPDGFRWNDEVCKIEYRVTVAAESSGTVAVKLDGADIASPFFTTNGAVVTLTATVPDNNVFAGWTGTTDVIAPSEVMNTQVVFTVGSAVSLTATYHQPATRTWTGAGSDGLASNPANWSEGVVPSIGDAIVLNSGNKNMTWDIDNVTLASWTQDGFTGKVIFKTGRASYSGTKGALSDDGLWRELRVTGDISIQSGMWTNVPNPTIATGLPEANDGMAYYRLIARAGGNFSLGANAVISVNNNGFAKSNGPFGNQYGHGAMGSTGYWGPTAGSKAYGSLKRPRTCGATGGGGNIEISAGGAATINGTLEARGYDGVTTNPHGPGGSIWLTANSFSGTGTFDVRNGLSHGGTYGSPGRIAIHLTGIGEDFSGFSGTYMYSPNGTGLGYSGTLYLQKVEDNGKGELFLKGTNGTGGNAWGSVRIGGTPIAMAEDDDQDLKRVTIENNVQAVVEAGTHPRVGEFVMGPASNVNGVYYNWIILRGGTLEMPGDWTPSNCWLRVYTADSCLKLGPNGDSTLIMTNSLNATCYWDRYFTLMGNLHVQNGCVVTHTTNGTADNNYRLNPHVTGWVTIDAGGSVNANGRGFNGGYGPGAPSVEGYLVRGGSHGGKAMDNGGVGCYGSVRCPTELGSGGGKAAGGGAMKLTVDGCVTNNGTISATGAGDNTLGSGAGGSVWIVATNIVGSGTISANGGNAWGWANGDADTGIVSVGAGGRISIKRTAPGAMASDFSGTIEAVPGKETKGSRSGSKLSGGSGTVYIEDADQQAGEGTLILDGTTAAYYRREPTEFNDSVTDYDVGNVIITNNAYLLVKKGGQLQVRGDFTNASDYMIANDIAEISDGITDGGTVEFIDATKVSHVIGTNRWADFVIATPDKEVQFGTAAQDSLQTFIPGGNFNVTGTQDHDVKLRSTVDGTYWPMCLDTGAAAAITYADVKDSDASTGLKVVVDDTSTDSKNNLNWGFVTIEPGETITWYGDSSSAFGDPGNWDLGRAPVETDNIVIKAVDVGDYTPVLGAALVANNITIESGASLDLAGYALTVTNDFACAGALTAGGASAIRFEGDVSFAGGTFSCGTSTVTLAGAAKQTVDFNGQTLYTLVIGQDTDFTGSLASEFLTCETTVPRTLAIGGGKRVTAATLTLLGEVADNALLTLAPLDAGVCYELKFTKKAEVRGVNVSYATAVGNQIVAELPGNDGGNNVNILFGTTSAVWTGAVNKNWDNAGNWSKGVIPDATTRVVFDAAATVTMPADSKVDVRVLEVSGATVTLTGMGELQGIRTSGAFEVLDGGVLCLDTPLEVGGFAYIRSGGTITHTAQSNKQSNDLGYGVRITVAGSMDIEDGGKIDAYGKGFYNGYGPGVDADGSSHGARRVASSPACYGSIFRPETLGSGGSGSSGGGRVHLNVAGTLNIDGTIDADAKTTSDRAGSGGSVLLECAELTGSGKVFARGGNYTLNVSPGCGGRIAVYQTVATSLGFEGTLGAWGGLYYTPTGLPTRPAGTLYVENAGDVANCGVLRIENNGGTLSSGTTGGADLPIVTDENLKVYRKMSVKVERGGQLFITRDVEIAELDIAAGGKVILNGHTLTIKSHKHSTTTPDGRGGRMGDWAGTVDYTTGDAGSTGKINFKPNGSVLILR